MSLLQKKKRNFYSVVTVSGFCNSVGSGGIFDMAVAVAN